MIMQKMNRPNRNGTSEAIRLPLHVVDFLKALSNARGISHQDLALEIVSGYIEVEKKKYSGVSS